MYQIFGKSPTISIVEWLIANQTGDHSMKEIADGAKLSMTAAKKGFKPLQKHHVIRVTRTIGRDKLYVLDVDCACTKAIILFDMKIAECCKEHPEEDPEEDPEEENEPTYDTEYLADPPEY